MQKVVRLDPRNLKLVWHQVRWGLQQVLPPTAVREQSSIRRILSMLLSTMAQCWAILQEDDTFGGFMITVFSRDPMTSDKTLHVYAVYSYVPIEAETWDKIQEAFKEFGPRNGCTKWTALTTSNRIISEAERVGADVSWTMVIGEL